MANIYGVNISTVIRYDDDDDDDDTYFAETMHSDLWHVNFADIVLRRLFGQVPGGVVLSLRGVTPGECESGQWGLPSARRRLSGRAAQVLGLHPVLHRGEPTGYTFNALRWRRRVHVLGVVPADASWGHLVDVFVFAAAVSFLRAIWRDGSVHCRWSGRHDSRSHRVQHAQHPRSKTRGWRKGARQALQRGFRKRDRAWSPDVDRRNKLNQLMWSFGKKRSKMQVS